MREKEERRKSSIRENMCTEKLYKSNINKTLTVLLKSEYLIP